MKNKPVMLMTRNVWMIKPVERVKPSKKVYNRKSFKIKFED